MTEEHKAKIGNSHWSNREDAAEIAEKMASKIRGRKNTEEQKARMSAAKRKRDEEKRTALAALLAGMEEPTPPKTGGARLPDRFVTK